MNPLIFLDIDGVLNHQLFYEKKSQAQRYGDVGHPLCDLDPDKVELLNELIKNTNAKVVISSIWRLGKTIGDLQLLLEKVGFIGEIVGLTPRLRIKGVRIPRGVEIYNYLEDNQENNTGYVILDDDSDMMLWQKNNFFWIDSYCGLTPTIVYKATNFLLS